MVRAMAVVLAMIAASGGAMAQTAQTAAPAITPAPSAAPPQPPPAVSVQPANPQIDFVGFTELAKSLEAYRDARRVPLKQFMVMVDAPDTLLLDARSADAYARGHIAGAVNLPFTDFTAQSLAQVVGPDRNRRILIYCNNNFTNNVDPVVVKGVRLALNVPTFINLYGYGYPNIYELADVVDFNSQAVRWTTGGKRY